MVLDQEGEYFLAMGDGVLDRGQDRLHGADAQWAMSR